MCALLVILACFVTQGMSLYISYTGRFSPGCDIIDLAVVFFHFLHVFLFSYPGHCLANFIDPPNGTTVSGFEGDVNATVFTCSVVSNDAQVTTTWSIRGLGGEPGLRTIFESDFVDLFVISGDERNVPIGNLTTFRNRLTIVNFTSGLEDATLFCGTGADPEFASFPLRLYRKFTK